jgi:UDP-glucose 4-epimerase
MRSLVTGGAGFIGSHLVDALVEAGDEVSAFDDLSTGRHENLAEAIGAGAELVVGDLTDAGAVGGAFADLEPERVFHLGAQVDVRRAVADPAFDAAVNVIGTINVLEAARARAAPIVLTSTGGAVYGEGAGRDLPLDESAEARSEAPYGMSKLAAEGYVDLYRRVHRVPGLAMRLGNVYGPRQDPHGEAGVVAIFCGALLEDRRPTVFGDGGQTRDYVYVADVVEALLLAAARLGEHGTGLAGPFNVGTGIETSVLDLVSRLGDLAGRWDVEPELAPARTGEVERIALDCSRAAAELGWRAEVGLEDGLERTLAWAREGAER